MPDCFSLPQGVRDFAPDIAEEIRKIEESLLGEFTLWGYRRVITPLFESLESILIGLGDDLRDKVLKFVDPSTGDVAALRPDITPQVGRMVAAQLRDWAKPIRLCYNGRLIRYEEKGSGKEREVFQVGCELVGHSSPEADAETIALAAKSLEKLGAKKLVLDIGHTGFLRFLLAKTGSVRKEIEEALKKKDRESLEKSVSKSPVPRTIKEVILSLPELYGSREILDKAEKAGITEKYVKELEQVLSLLDEFGLNSEINIDLGEIRGFNYYTGVTFEIVSPYVSSPIVRGGRYDELIGKYGYDCAATGFAVDVESLLGITSVSTVNNHVHFVVVPDSKPIRRGKNLRSEAINLAERLRSNGFKAVLELRPKPDVQTFIEKNRTANLNRIIFLEAPDKISLIESQGGGSREFSSFEELLKEVRR